MLSSEDINFAALYFFEGIEFAAEGEFMEAQEKFSLALERDPCNLRILFNRQVLFDMDAEKVDHETAQRYFSAVLEVEKGKPEAALSQLEDVPRSFQNYAPLVAQKGISAFASGSSEYGIKLLSGALAHLPQDAWLLHHRALMYEKTGRSELALDDLTSSIDLAPDYHRNYFHRAKIYSTSALHNKAIADIEKALAINPTYKRMLQESLDICRIYNARGMTRLQSGQAADAIGDFEKAIDICRMFAEPYLNRGIAYRRQRNYQRAILDFNRAIDLDQTYTASYYNRGLTFKDMDYKEQAIRDLVKVTVFSPKFLPAHLALGELYYDSGDYSEAIDRFDTIISLDPDHHWAWYRKALACDRKKKYRAAIEAYEYFIKIAPGDLYEYREKAWDRAQRLRKWVYRKRKKY